MLIYDGSETVTVRVHDRIQMTLSPSFFYNQVIDCFCIPAFFRMFDGYDGDIEKVCFEDEYRESRFYISDLYRSEYSTLIHIRRSDLVNQKTGVVIPVSFCFENLEYCPSGQLDTVALSFQDLHEPGSEENVERMREFYSTAPFDQLWRTWRSGDYDPTIDLYEMIKSRVKKNPIQTYQNELDPDTFEDHCGKFLCPENDYSYESSDFCCRIDKVFCCISPVYRESDFVFSLVFFHSDDKTDFDTLPIEDITSWDSYDVDSPVRLIVNPLENGEKDIKKQAVFELCYLKHHKIIVLWEPNDSILMSDCPYCTDDCHF